MLSRAGSFGFAFLWALAAAMPSSAQTYHLPTFPDIFAPYAEIPLQLGDGFTARGNQTHVTVKLVGNDASATGRLYFLDPATGQDRFLFLNKADSLRGIEIDLGVFPQGTPIVFKYVTNGQPPKYTGANAAGAYDFDAQPALAGLPINHQPMPVSPEVNDQGDNRWAVAGRVDARQVIFGFEDMRGGDYDYNDIVFIVTGVALDSEVKLGVPVITAGGSFEDSVRVTVNMPDSLPGVKIFYTRDGSAPTFDSLGNPLGSTQVYSGPITLSGSATIRAVAWKASETDSGGGVIRYRPSEAAVSQFVKLDAYAVAGAAYLDENGDGRIDAVRIAFASPPAGPPDSLYLEDPFRAGYVTALEGARLLADGATWKARFADKPFAFGTGFATGPFGRFSAKPVRYGGSSFAVEDSAGPVIVSAEALPPDSLRPPRLRLVFSEDVNLDVQALQFPYALKRPTGPDPNGKVSVSAIMPSGDRAYDYYFSEVAAAWPVAGDSIKLLPSPLLRDTKGRVSDMGFFAPVTGKPAEVSMVLGIQGGGWVTGEDIPNPKPVSIPITLTLPGNSGGTPVCLECGTGDWVKTDPARPASFPSGPRLDVVTKGPFTFNLAFFDNRGAFINRAKGKVTEAMLEAAPLDPQGNRRVSMMWYPVSESGNQAATGAYICKGTLRSAGGLVKGPQGEDLRLFPAAAGVLVSFGYVRR